MVFSMKDNAAEDNSALMNEELQEWLEAARAAKKTSDKSGKSKKKPTGKCQICGEKNAKFVCLKCERSVCMSCYFKIIGVCKKCVPKDTAEKWEAKSPDWEKVLGVEWVD